MLETWLDALLDAVPPPAQPCNPECDEDWPAVESYFGLSFPADYKRLIRHYGSGAWGGYLWTLNPFSVNRYLNPRLIMEDPFSVNRYLNPGLILENSHLWCAEEPEPPCRDPVFLERWDQLRQRARTRRRASPYPFFPERPGLFPWASSGPEVHREEHWLYWLAGGAPDRWPVVIERWSGGPHFSQPVHKGYCELLLGWLRGESIPDGFPSPTVVEQGRWFVPQFPNPQVLTTYSWPAECQG